MGEVPVLLQCFTLVGEHRDAVGGDGGGRVILGREDVAGCPADIGAQRRQRLDQHGGLDGHVQRAGDAGTIERLPGLILLAHRHKTRHFGLGDSDFLTAPLGQGKIGDVIVSQRFFAHNGVHSVLQIRLNGRRWLVKAMPYRA